MHHRYTLTLLLIVALSMPLSVLAQTKAEKIENQEEQHALSGNLAKLQGTWQSTDDPAVVVEIQGDQFTERYNGEGDALTIRFLDTCEGRPEDPEERYFTLTDESGSLCYYLIRADETVLEYSYLPRGNTHSFRRMR